MCVGAVAAFCAGSANANDELIKMSRLGPSLRGVIGRKAGSLPNYSNYSDSMKNSDLVWDKNNMERFIANPDQVVPGNNMKPFAGVASADERAKIVAFLESVAK